MATSEQPPFNEAPSAGWVPSWWTLLRHYGRLLSLIKAASASKLTDEQNKFRAKVCGLGAVGIGRLRELNHTPSLMGYSPHVVPTPSDWGAWLSVSGYTQTAGQGHSSKASEWANV